MSDFFNFLIEKLKTIVEISSNIFKLSIFLGISLALYHFKEINYLPKDLTIGDGLSFILISCKFALIFTFFMGSIFVGSKVVSYIFLVVNTIYRDRYLFIPRLILNILSFFIYDVLTISFYEKFILVLSYVVALAFSFLFYTVFWDWSLLGIFLFFGCSVLVALFSHVFDLLRNRTDLSSKDKHAQMTMSLVFSFVFPLFIYSYFSEKQKIIEFSTSSLKENDKNAIFYLKKDESDLFPPQIIKKGDLENYVLLTHTKIILRGFGRNALVEYEYEDRAKRVFLHAKVEVPNEAIQIKWKQETPTQN